MTEVLKSALRGIMNSRYSERFGRALGRPVYRESTVFRLKTWRCFSFYFNEKRGHVF